MLLRQAGVPITHLVLDINVTAEEVAWARASRKKQSFHLPPHRHDSVRFRLLKSHLTRRSSSWSRKKFRPKPRTSARRSVQAVKKLTREKGKGQRPQGHQACRGKDEKQEAAQLEKAPATPPAAAAAERSRSPPCTLVEGLNTPPVPQGPRPKYSFDPGVDFACSLVFTTSYHETI